MRVRDYQSWDQGTIRHWHEASGFAYELPHFPTENLAAQKVVVDGIEPVAAAFAKVTVEIYGFQNPAFGTPGLRLAALKLLQASIAEELRRQNISGGFAWLPPELAKSFGRRLLKTFGWKRPLWPCFAKDV